MRDPRLDKLAKLLIEYSVALQPGERLLIEVTGLETALVQALIQQAYAVGGLVYVSIKDHEILREMLQGISESALADIAVWERQRMEAMDAYIGIRAGRNRAELSDISPEKMELYQRLWMEPVHVQVRVPQTRWCVLRYPNHSMAQSANMSLSKFEDFYFDVCTLDYRRMWDAMDALVARLMRTDEVHITGPGIDLRFSIKGMAAVKCAGKRNIPDGEVYTAPVRDSVEGTITYNVPSVYQGFTFSSIRLRFEKGRIVAAEANDSARLNKVLDTDAGARYVGEFSLGLNPFIAEPMKDTLFDEKIHGSFHFTPGNAYALADNGNRSAIHWDLISIQRPEYGGGSIYFDGELVRQDGRFVVAELSGLNREALAAK